MMCVQCGLRPCTKKYSYRCSACLNEKSREARITQRATDAARTFSGPQCCRGCGDVLYQVEDWQAEIARDVTYERRWFCGDPCRTAWIERTFDLDMVVLAFRK